MAPDMPDDERTGMAAFGHHWRKVAGSLGVELEAWCVTTVAGGDVEATYVSRVLENRRPLPLPELRFSLLLSTACPSSTGEYR